MNNKIRIILGLICIALIVIGVKLFFSSNLPVSQTFAPHWEIGEKWTVKEHILLPIQSNTNTEEWSWQYWGFEVTGIEKVNNQECFVIEKQPLKIDSNFRGVKDILYFSTESLKLLRQTTYGYTASELQPPVTIDYSYSKNGPFFDESWPYFPLSVSIQKEQKFELLDIGDYSAYVRQAVNLNPIPSELKITSIEGDNIYQSADKKCFQVLIEQGSPINTNIVPQRFSNQVWCKDLPWSLYKENGEYFQGGKKIYSQIWLIK